MSGPTITIGHDGESAFAWISSRNVPLEKFKALQESIEGSRYDFKKRRRLVPIDKIPAILVRLRNAGLAVHLEPELKDTLQRYTAQMWNDLKAAQDRIQKIDDAFYEMHKQRLYAFQRVGAQWLATRHGGLLADEMGLGKTLQTIAAMPAGVPMIVVAPAVAKGVWVREIAKWRPHVRVRVLEGRGSFTWPEDGEMLVTNYDILPEVHDKTKCSGELPREKCPGCAEAMSPHGIAVKVAGHKVGCDGYKPARPCPGCAQILHLCPPQLTMIADEAHNLKSGKAARTQKFRAISRTVRELDGRVWLLTATPLLNNPSELWSVYAAAGIEREAFGDWKNFVHIFKGKALKFGGYEWGTPEAEVAERIRRVALRRMRAEVATDIPAKTWSEITVDLKDAATRKECDRLLKSVGGAEGFEEIIKLEKLSFEMMSSVRASLASAKIPAMLDFVKDFEAQDEPLVVFSAHRAPIDVLAKRPGWRVITGDTPAEERTEIERLFQAGELKGIGSTIKAGGVAITLTRAAFALFVDLEWTPALNAQAEDRICRIGQKRPPVIYILKADHILDQRVTALLMKKRELIAASVDASSVNDSIDREFEEHVHRIQAEIAQGRAVRRMAESLEEVTAVTILHTHLFPNESDRKLAHSLAEESEVVGLSEAQWELACRVAARGTEPGVGSGPMVKRRRRRVDEETGT